MNAHPPGRALLLLLLALAPAVCRACPGEEVDRLLKRGKPEMALRYLFEDRGEWPGKTRSLCRAAGDLHLDDAYPWLERGEAMLAAALLDDDVANDPEYAEDRTLYRHLQWVRQSIRYITLRGYEASERETLMGFYQRLSAADNMLKMIPADSPLADLAAFWRGRIHFWFGREGGDKKEYELARRLFAPLKEKYPNHRILRMYLGEQVPSPVTGALAVPAGAPEWAVKAREALVRAGDIFHWWVENRQVASGEMGGGWGDDCEMLRNWPVAILAGDDDAVRAGWRKMAHGIWECGEVHKGYARAMTDVEHGAEPVGDTHSAMIGLDYGNPVFVQRSLLPMRQMRDVWTAVNPKGHRHFKSHMYSATAVRLRPGDDTDTCYNARAAQPGIWAGWYARNPALVRLLSEYAAAWIAHAPRTEAGKPAGVLPGNIRFATDRTGEFAPWQQGYFGWDFEAYSLMYDLLFAAYALTGDPALEKGITDALAFCRQHLTNPGPHTEPSGPSERALEAGDKMEGAAALRMTMSQSGSGFVRSFPPANLDGTEFVLRVKPLDANLQRVTVSFFEHEGERAARHSYEKFRVGEWNTLRVLAGRRDGTDSWERNRGDLAKAGRIHFYADLKEAGKPCALLWDGFVEVRDGKPSERAAAPYEEGFDQLPGLAAGSPLLVARALIGQVMPAAEKWRIHTGKTGYDDLLRVRGSHYMRWLLSGNRKDKSLLAASCDEVIRGTQFNRELLTSEVLFTDRVWVRGTEPVLSLYTGSVGTQSYYPMYAVSWENTGQDVAALVTDNRADAAGLLAYNLGEKPRPVALRFWRLAPGEYSWRLGPDADGDDRMDAVAESRTVVLRERGERVRFTLPPRQVVVLEVRQRKAAPARGPLPDVAVAAEEITAIPGAAGKPADLFVPVHNLGPAPAANVTVTIRTGEGKEAKSVRVPVSLPASVDLAPVFRTVHVRLPLPTARPATTLSLAYRGHNLRQPAPAVTSRVSVSLAYSGAEITKGNNAAEAGGGPPPTPPAAGGGGGPNDRTRRHGAARRSPGRPGLVRAAAPLRPPGRAPAPGPRAPGAGRRPAGGDPAAPGHSAGVAAQSLGAGAEPPGGDAPADRGETPQGRRGGGGAVRAHRGRCRRGHGRRQRRKGGHPRRHGRDPFHQGAPEGRPLPGGGARARAQVGERRFLPGSHVHGRAPLLHPRTRVVRCGRHRPAPRRHRRAGGAHPPRRAERGDRQGDVLHGRGCPGAGGGRAQLRTGRDVRGDGGRQTLLLGVGARGHRPLGPGRGGAADRPPHRPAGAAHNGAIAASGARRSAERRRPEAAAAGAVSLRGMGARQPRLHRRPTERSSEPLRQGDAQLAHGEDGRRRPARRVGSPARGRPPSRGHHRRLRPVEGVRHPGQRLVRRRLPPCRAGGRAGHERQVTRGSQSGYEKAPTLRRRGSGERRDLKESSADSAGSARGVRGLPPLRQALRTRSQGSQAPSSSDALPGRTESRPGCRTRLLTGAYTGVYTAP